MIIGCYRSNEVDETQSFSKAVRDLRLRLNDGGCLEGIFEITDISIGNLNVPASRTIISDLLSTEESQLHELAQVCHDKTHGNAFFLIHFLTMLYNENFLEFQIGAFQWKYDIKEIQAATGSTDNVADLVKARMVSLDQDTLLAVKLAGCLGARFQQHILEILHEQFCESTSAQAFGTVLENLMREEILQEEGRTFVQWVHDKIQGRITFIGDFRHPNSYRRL
jgi:predicted ATPase